MNNSKRTCLCADGKIAFGRHRMEVEGRCHCFRSSYERRSLPQCVSEASDKGSASEEIEREQSEKSQAGCDLWFQ